jgi:hypothetical protein
MAMFRGLRPFRPFDCGQLAGANGIGLCVALPNLIIILGFSNFAALLT